MVGSGNGARWAGARLCDGTQVGAAHGIWRHAEVL